MFREKVINYTVSKFDELTFQFSKLKISLSKTELSNILPENKFWFFNKNSGNFKKSLGVLLK